MKRGCDKCVVQFSFIGIVLSFIMAETENSIHQEIEQATFGAGCFWCVEAVFERLEGVVDVQAGYSGGNTENPTYEEVCTGKTGHAEVIRIDYDPSIICFDKLLDVFWKSHDPTTLNRQGGDVGTQYRSAILYHNAVQKTAAEKSLAATDSSDMYVHPIVTEVLPMVRFYLAEQYHQNYFKNNSSAPYCMLYIQPKLTKLFSSE